MQDVAATKLVLIRSMSRATHSIVCELFVNTYQRSRTRAHSATPYRQPSAPPSSVTELLCDAAAVAVSSTVMGFLSRSRTRAMRIDTAWLHARRAIADLAAEATDGPMSYLHSTRGQADSGYAATLLRETASTLVSLAGGSSFATTNAMQRAWRDITVGCSHAMLNGTASLELHGRALLGRESNSPFWGPDAAFLA